MLWRLACYATCVPDVGAVRAVCRDELALGPVRPDRPAPGESALLPLAGQAHDPDHLRRALRGRAESGLRLQAVPGDAAIARLQSHPHVQRGLLRAGGRVQDREQHPRPGPGQSALPVGPQRHARLCQRRQQVRPDPVGPAVLPAADGLRRGGGPTGHRRRAGPVLPLLRGLDVATEPDERPQQRQRDRRRSSGPRSTRSRTAVCWPCRTRWCSGSSRP